MVTVPVFCLKVLITIKEFAVDCNRILFALLGILFMGATVAVADIF